MLCYIVLCQLCSVSVHVRVCVNGNVCLVVTVCECVMCLTDSAIVPDGVQQSPHLDANEYIVVVCILAQWANSYCLAKLVFVSLAACSCLYACMMCVSEWWIRAYKCCIFACSYVCNCVIFHFSCKSNMQIQATYDWNVYVYTNKKASKIYFVKLELIWFGLLINYNKWLVIF